MQTKEEILKRYAAHSADGMPEIALEGLLKAMEEYRLQAEEAAFNAARQSAENISNAAYTYPTFAAYKASLETAPVADDQTANIQLIADSILEQFLPNDATVQALNFNIRTEGKGYTVNYVKNAQGYWYFSGFSNAEE